MPQPVNDEFQREQAIKNRRKTVESLKLFRLYIIFITAENPVSKVLRKLYVSGLFLVLQDSIDAAG